MGPQTRGRVTLVTARPRRSPGGDRARLLPDGTEAAEAAALAHSLDKKYAEPEQDLKPCPTLLLPVYPFRESRQASGTFQEHRRNLPSASIQRVPSRAHSLQNKTVRGTEDLKASLPKAKRADP
ncbi:hypothetical protein H1C71_004951 [Ictidomys tridecemlineatus]|nr:hypothetical protein H1C71_004951 [Ictidomys tridecemlineatus]